MFSGSLGLGWGVLACFVLPTPPAQCRGWSGQFGRSIVAQDTVFEFFGLGFVVFLRVLSCRPPPLSAEAGLGTLADLLWPRTCILTFGPGLGWFLRFFCLADPLAECRAMVWVIGPLN